MFLLLTLAALVVGLLVIGGVFIYLKKKQATPLTSASIPPIPSPQEANLHFTPVNAPIAPVVKPGINKKLLISLAVIFNVILIGTVIYIGQSILKPQKTASNTPSTPVATPQPVLPTAVPGNSLLPDSISPTCAPMPACVASNQCDISAPAGGWCAVPTFPPDAVISGTTASSSAGVPLLPTGPTSVPSSTPTPTTAFVTALFTPTPTQIVVTVLSSTPVPTTASAVAAAPVVATTAPTTVASSTLPQTGASFSLLVLIIPAIFVAIAFVL